MRVVQEENIAPVEHHIQSRYSIEPMAALFFTLGMFMCAFVLHQFIL